MLEFGPQVSRFVFRDSFHDCFLNFLERAAERENSSTYTSIRQKELPQKVLKNNSHSSAEVRWRVEGRDEMEKDRPDGCRGRCWPAERLDQAATAAVNLSVPNVTSRATHYEACKIQLSDATLVLVGLLCIELH